jgi:predicted NBD/HSP70 family sugar kinase
VRSIDDTSSLRGRRLARERIVAALIRGGAASRADLARATSLAPSTVSSAVAELVAEGIVVEHDGAVTPAKGAKGGRPATLVTLHRSAGIAVGVDVGKTHVRVAVADLSHQVIAERFTRSEPDRPAPESIALIAQLVQEALEEAQVLRSQVIGVGVGVPGPVTPNGRVADTMILSGWAGLDVLTMLTDALDLPVVVDNDANLGAIAEWTWGSGRGCTDLVYLKVSTGIGGGLILGGRPYRGGAGIAGEIGHNVIDPAGPICRCGNRGCLEALAGTQPILASLRPVHGEQLTIEQVVELATAGDLPSRRAVADAGQAIGRAAATMCNLLGPTRIVVGGELSSAGAILLDPLREALHRHTLPSAAAELELVQATLGRRAEVLGALTAAVRHQIVEE